MILSHRQRTQAGAELHQIRRTLGLTQQQMAAQLGVAPTSYSRWERRRATRKPRAVFLQRARSLVAQHPRLTLEGYAARWGRDPQMNFAMVCCQLDTQQLVEALRQERADSEDIAAWGLSQAEWYDGIVAALTAHQKQEGDDNV